MRLGDKAVDFKSSFYNIILSTYSSIQHLSEVLKRSAKKIDTLNIIRDKPNKMNGQVCQIRFDILFGFLSTRKRDNRKSLAQSVLGVKPFLFY